MHANAYDGMMRPATRPTILRTAVQTLIKAVMSLGNAVCLDMVAKASPNTDGLGGPRRSNRSCWRSSPGRADGVRRSWPSCMATNSTRTWMFGDSVLSANIAGRPTGIAQRQAAVARARPRTALLLASYRSIAIILLKDPNRLQMSPAISLRGDSKSSPLFQVRAFR